MKRTRGCFLIINNFAVLFGCFHRFDDGGGKSVVFQFVDSLDRNSARSSHFVDFYERA